MRPQFQKQGALKFDGRMIPEAKLCGIIEGLISLPLECDFVWIPRCLRRGIQFRPNDYFLVFPERNPGCV